MEIYNFYQTIRQMLNLASSEETSVVFISAGITVALFVGLFILQGIGLCAMAKKQGVGNCGLAFIPFVNIWYIGKLAGECHFFSQRVKRAGLYAMLAQILLVTVSLATIGAEQYLWLKHGAPQVAKDYDYYYWTGLTGFSSHLSRFVDISGYLMLIFQLLAEIFLVVLMMGLCKKYAPKNYTMLGFLVLFIPMARFVIIFVLRKRQPIDFEAYMRARREAFMRSQQYYGQNPYGNSYGRPYNPYGQNQGNASGAPRNDEPFEEFSSGKKGDDEPFEEMRGSSDDFFN